MTPDSPREKYVCRVCRYVEESMPDCWERKSKCITSFHVPISPIIAQAPSPLPADALRTPDYYQHVRRGIVTEESVVYWTLEPHAQVFRQIESYLTSHHCRILSHEFELREFASAALWGQAPPPSQFPRARITADDFGTQVEAVVETVQDRLFSETPYTIVAISNTFDRR